MPQITDLYPHGVPGPERSIAPAPTPGVARETVNIYALLGPRKDELDPLGEMLIRRSIDDYASMADRPSILQTHTRPAVVAFDRAPRGAFRR